MIHTRLDCGCLRQDACSWHAAAPALLEALEAMVKAHPGGDDRDMCVGTECLCNNARDAIKLAKGESKRGQVMNTRLQERATKIEQELTLAAMRAREARNERDEAKALAERQKEALERISNGAATINESTSPDSMLATIRDIVAQARDAIKLVKGPAQ